VILPRQRLRAWSPDSTGNPSPPRYGFSTPKVVPAFGTDTETRLGIEDDRAAITRELERAHGLPTGALA
jgi:hypothetical protein